MTITRYEITTTVIDVAFEVEGHPAHVVLDRKEYDEWIERYKCSAKQYWRNANYLLCLDLRDFLTTHKLHNTWQQYEGIIYNSKRNNITSPTLERYDLRN